TRAHALGIVHRDIKPANVFLARVADESGDVAKLLDFGIAKVETPLGLSQEGAILGTPYYMSPEQARGASDVDFRADLWSLAVIAYQCVTGVRPFESGALGDLLVAICQGSILAPSQFVPGLPYAFDAWIARGLARDPARRFQSAAALASALEECAERDNFDEM